MIDYIIFSVQVAIAAWVGTMAIPIILSIGFILIAIPIAAIVGLRKWIRRNFYKEEKD